MRSKKESVYSKYEGRVIESIACKECKESVGATFGMGFGVLKYWVDKHADHEGFVIISHKSL